MSRRSGSPADPAAGKLVLAAACRVLFYRSVDSCEWRRRLPWQHPRLEIAELQGPLMWCQASRWSTLLGKQDARQMPVAHGTFRSADLNLTLAILQAIKAVDKDQRQIRAARRKSEKIISASERPDARRCRITRPGPATRSKNEPRPVALPMRAFGQDYRSVGRLAPLFRLT